MDTCGRGFNLFLWFLFMCVDYQWGGVIIVCSRVSVLISKFRCSNPIRGRSNLQRAFLCVPGQILNCLIAFSFPYKMGKLTRLGFVYIFQSPEVWSSVRVKERLLVFERCYVRRNSFRTFADNKLRWTWSTSSIMALYSKNAKMKKQCRTRSSK